MGTDKIKIDRKAGRKGVRTALATIAAAVLASSCGGTAQPDTNAAPSSQQANGTTTVVEKPGPTIDLPAGERANRPSRGASIGDLANRPQRADSDPNAAPPPPEFRPAGENSKTAVSMGADGVVREVRIFDGHPRLAKVELTLLPSGEKDLKFTMTDGKIVERRTNKINDLATARSIDLLAIAGR
ncbi:MAG: hypothetical protein AB7J13_00650 [Pyrinomonadaceae bacterium]